jgi:molecular chaperone GrpE
MSDDVRDHESESAVTTDTANEAAPAEVPEEDTPAEVDPLLAALRQRDEYLEALQRLQADFENYRKRVARTSEEVAARVAGDLVVKLLTVLDAFDLARAHFAASESDEAVALTQTRGLLLDTLSKEGLDRIDEVGGPFDPQVHDAVAHEPGDAEHPVVDEVLRAGYRWKGAVVRPAMVRVKG